MVSQHKGLLPSPLKDIMGIALQGIFILKQARVLPGLGLRYYPVDSFTIKQK